MFLPGTIGILVVGIVLGSYEDAKSKGFNMSKPSLRDALESYIETGEGDAVRSLNLESIVRLLDIRSSSIL